MVASIKWEVAEGVMLIHNKNWTNFYSLRISLIFAQILKWSMLPTTLLYPFVQF
jgi:hypothetical protein